MRLGCVQCSHDPRGGIIALVVLAGALPATAHGAAQTNAPPGNSAIDEYLEVVPSAGGTTSARPRAGGSGELTAAQRARLERRGRDGKALADVVDATASERAPARTKQPEPKPREHPQAPSSPVGSAPAGEVLGAVAGSDRGIGIGIVLPAILIGSLLAAVVIVALRRRASS